MRKFRRDNADNRAPSALPSRSFLKAEYCDVKVEIRDLCDLLLIAES